MKKILIILILILTVSCTQQISEENKLSCNSDQDCQIKNVGNCCGYFPECVNKGYEPNLTKVQQECFEEGIASVCGFPEISGCECVNNTCKNI